MTSIECESDLRNYYAGKFVACVVVDSDRPYNNKVAAVDIISSPDTCIG